MESTILFIVVIVLNFIYLTATSNTKEVEEENLKEKKEGKRNV
jgi:hypothetical protein